MINHINEIKNSVSNHIRKEFSAKILKNKLTLFMITEMLYLLIHTPPFYNYNIHLLDGGNVLVYS